MKVIIWILLILLACEQVTAQSRQEPANRADGQEEEAPDYEPYSEDEFPPWLREIRRAEVILIGSFPIAMLYASLSYEGARAIINAVKGVETPRAQGFGRGEFTQEERKGVLLAGTLLSVAVAITDFILGRIDLNDGE